MHLFGNARMNTSIHGSETKFKWVEVDEKAMPDYSKYNDVRSESVRYEDIHIADCDEHGYLWEFCHSHSYNRPSNHKHISYREPLS